MIPKNLLCRAGIDTQTENELVDTVGEGRMN